MLPVRRDNPNSVSYTRKYSIFNKYSIIYMHVCTSLCRKDRKVSALFLNRLMKYMSKGSKNVA